MKTVIEWKDPAVEAPPFNKRILALLGGSGSNDCMQTWTQYVHFCDVVISRTSPNDEDEFSEYEEFTIVKGKYPYSEYQFHVAYWHEMKFGSRENLDWYSDSISRWAPMPDFSEVLK